MVYLLSLSSILYTVYMLSDHSLRKLCCRSVNQAYTVLYSLCVQKCVVSNQMFAVCYRKATDHPTSQLSLSSILSTVYTLSYHSVGKLSAIDQSTRHTQPIIYQAYRNEQSAIRRLLSATEKLQISQPANSAFHPFCLLSIRCPITLQVNCPLQISLSAPERLQIRQPVNQLSLSSIRRTEMNSQQVYVCCLLHKGYRSPNQANSAFHPFCLLSIRCPTTLQANCQLQIRQPGLHSLLSIRRTEMSRQQAIRCLLSATEKAIDHPTSQLSLSSILSTVYRLSDHSLGKLSAMDQSTGPIQPFIHQAYRNVQSAIRCLLSATERLEITKPANSAFHPFCLLSIRCLTTLQVNCLLQIS